MSYENSQDVRPVKPICSEIKSGDGSACGVYGKLPKGAITTGQSCLNEITSIEKRFAIPY